MKMKTFVLLGVVVLCLGAQSHAYAPHTYSMSQLGPDMTTNVKTIALDAAGTGLLVGEGGNSASIVLNSLDIAIYETFFALQPPEQAGSPASMP